MIERERERIRAARYVPGRRFEEGLEAALHKLPRRKHRSPQERYMMAAGAAAAFVLFCVFAAPPIVRAATALIERVFGANIQKIEQYEAMEEDEKLARQIADAEMHSRGHDVNASTDFEGVTVTLTSFELRPNDAFDAGRVDGYLAMAIEYSEIPPFDPNWMDFAITLGGASYPMELGDGLTTYREQNLHAVTEDDWWSSDFGWYSNSQVIEGRATTYMFFPLPEWKFSEPTDFVLRGTIDGESFDIPFTFDPVLAHEQAVAEGVRAAALTEEWNREKKQALEQLSEGAAQIGLTGSADGVEYVLSEIAYADGILNVSASFSGVEEANPKLAGMLYSVADMYADGYPAVSVEGDSESLGEGAHTSIQTYMLGRDPNALPEESLIEVQLMLGFGEQIQTVPVAFRYNWSERRVTLPEGDEQMAAWLQQADALKNELAARTPYQTVYDLKPLNLTQTLNGLTVTLTQAEIGVGRMNVAYKLTRDPSYKGATIMTNHYWMEGETEHIIEPDATLDGLPASYAGDTWSGDSIPERGHFELPLHATQIGGDTPVTVHLPFRMNDRKGKEVYRETFEFSFSLDRERMKPEDIWENPFKQ